MRAAGPGLAAACTRAAQRSLTCATRTLAPEPAHSLGFGQGVDVDHVDCVGHDAILDGQLEEPAACGKQVNGRQRREGVWVRGWVKRGAAAGPCAPACLAASWGNPAAGNTSQQAAARDARPPAQKLRKASRPAKKHRMEATTVAACQAWQNCSTTMTAENMTPTDTAAGGGDKQSRECRWSSAAQQWRRT